MIPMLPHLGQAALTAPRPQQPTRQGLLGQARSVVGGLLGGVQDQFRRGQESDEGFNLLRFRPPAGMNQSEMIMLAGAGLQDLDPLFGGGRMQAAQQMIDQRIQGRQAEEAQRAQREQMQAFRATLPPEQQAMFDLNPQGFMDQMTRAEFRAPPALLQAYQTAVSQGFQGSLIDYQAEIQRAGASQTNVNVDTGRRETPDQMVRAPMLAATGERAAGQVNAGLAASRNLVRIGRLEELFANTPQGAEGAIVQIAGNFGIPLTEGTSDVQAAAALINSMVPEQRPPGSGPMSDADLELFKQSVPRIINQPGGNRLIIETMRGVANYDIQLGEIARAFEAGQIDLPEYNRRISALNNPIDMFRDQISGVSGAASGLSDMSNDDLFSVLAGGGRR